MSKHQSYHRPVPSAMRWKKDGEDHINIWEDGETEIGRLLDHRYYHPFNHSIFGKFHTLEGFDYYLQSEEKDDRLRMLRRMSLKRFTKDLKKVSVTNFKAIILDTHYQRIKQIPELFEMVRSSVLPFDVYHVIKETGLRERPMRHGWLVSGLEEIRNAIKDNRDPNFTTYRSNQKGGIYDPLLKQLKLNPV